MSKLELKDITYSYKTKHQTVNAVGGISHCFESGKLYALVGKSGCGKTTLMSLIAALDKPNSGEILYEGISSKDIDSDRLRREKVSVIYQNYNLFPLLNALENVMYPLQISGVPRAQWKDIAGRSLLDVGLGEDKHRRYPAQLSGGEQQRVAIARAIGTNAEIILSDEPTGNLDSENAAKIIDILKSLAHGGKYCVIVVTHDMAVAEQADCVLKMSDGRIVSEV